MKKTLVLQIIYTILSRNLEEVTAVNSTKCSENHYRPLTDPSKCLPCSVCSIGQFIKKHCSEYKNTVCKTCAEGSFSVKANSLKCSKCPKNTFLHDGRCRNCTKCKPGQYSSRACSSSKDTECKDCLLGSYNLEENVAEYCKPCRKCKRNRVYTQRCNRTQDSVCGGCEPGYYEHENTKECRKCSYCYPKSPGYTYKINACLNIMHDPNYSCMEVVAPPPLIPSTEFFTTILPVSDSPRDVGNGVKSFPWIVFPMLLFVLVVLFLLLWKFKCKKNKHSLIKMRPNTPGEIGKKEKRFLLKSSTEISNRVEMEYSLQV